MRRATLSRAGFLACLAAGVFATMSVGCNNDKDGNMDNNGSMGAMSCCADGQMADCCKDGQCDKNCEMQDGMKNKAK